MKIYHLVVESEWEDSRDDEYYAAPSIERDGLVYCSTADQVIATANRFYIGTKSLLLLVIDPDRVQAEIVFEDLHGNGIKHPHIYGKVPLEAIEAVLPLEPDESGKFSALPSGARR